MARKIDLLKEQLAFLEKHEANAVEIDAIKDKIAKSKKAKRSREKGNSYERDIAKLIEKRFPILKMVRTPQSGGFNKESENTLLRGDISNLTEGVDFNLHLECKNHKKWSLPEWIKQARNDSPSCKIPVVVFHQQQENVDGKRTQQSDDFICIKLSDFLNIVDESKVIKKLEV